MEILSYTVLFLGLISLARLGFFMISADIYDHWHARRQKRTPKEIYRPLISIIIPAYNEELCIIRTLDSVLANDYAHKQIIVVDDGSKDRTPTLLQEYQRQHPAGSLTIVSQKNQGKAAAINNALQNYAKGELVMVLDADSLLHSQAVVRMADHFRNPRATAIAANVKVINKNSILGLAQQLEYVISHRLKRALTVMNMEYIIGGVGSTFRRSVIEACGYYDTDTLTEDIDVTMKIINKKGNRAYKIGFAADVIAYTEAVSSFKGLLKQRFRWKYGRMQTFVKNRRVFFSRHQKHSAQLTWVYLPFVVLSELILLFDPLFTGFVLWISYIYGGFDGVLSAYIAVSIFSVLNVLAETTEPLRNKLKLLAISPFSYGLILIMSLVDFLVLVKCVGKLPALLRGKNKHSNWEHVERTGGAVSLPE